MDRIRIHEILSQKRREKGISQQHLADFLGVSKPAVSKWEAGKSYPDITLLPIIAGYFDMTVDELIGYEPQLTKKEINRIYQRLSEDFAHLPFDEVYKECQRYIKTYYSCWPFLLSMGLLLINHAALAGNPERQEKLLYEAIELFQRIIDEGDKPDLAEQAKALVGACYLYLQKPERTVELLEEKMEVPLSREILLAKAYENLGELPKAKMILQGNIYKSLMEILSSLPDMIQLYVDDREKMKRYYSMTKELISLFQVKDLNPGMLLQIYYTFAHLFARVGDFDVCLESIEEFTDVALMPNLFPLELKGSEIFDQLEGWFEKMDIARHAPRNSELIKRDLKEVIMKNPLFQPLHENRRFQSVLWKLQQI